MGDSAVSQFPGFAREHPIRDRHSLASAVREAREVMPFNLTADRIRTIVSSK